jgi:hypothetical protein
MEDDCWTIQALPDENSLAASIALKEEFIETIGQTVRLSLF